MPFNSLCVNTSGIRVDAKSYLAGIQVQAEKDKVAALER